MIRSSLRDLALATLGGGLALGASALLSASPVGSTHLFTEAFDAPPEMRVGMDVAPILPRNALPPAGQVRQVVGSWVLIKTGDEFTWVNFDQVLLYKTDRR